DAAEPRAKHVGPRQPPEQLGRGGQPAAWPPRLRGIMIEDSRVAARVLLKSPAYSLVALVTLALGIGATVAIFSAVYAVLLAPLPYPDPDTLVVPVSTNAARGFDRSSVPYGDYLDWREQRDIFAQVAVWQPTRLA